MCLFRRVRNVYLRCNHTNNLPDEEIKCFREDCIFSPNHPATCTGDSCRDKCWQYHQYPQQYSPNINGYCPNCVALGMH